ncbi:MAG: hypothetical protein H0W84_01245 [Bacteroidetes bacterium]|nr:hypothetical protein [Bacteroidota bacterium]
MKIINRKINYSIIFSLSVLMIGLLLIAFSSGTQASYLYSPAAISDTTLKLEYYLELKGNVRQSKSITDKEEIKAIDSALVTIYSDKILFSETITNKKGRCVFKIPLDKKFRVVVSKRGFTTKFFEVFTGVPMDKKNTFTFSFDIDLFEEVKGLDISILQKPIAKITYNLIVEQFQYDIGYTSRINQGLKKMYKNYYAIQKHVADSLNTIPANMPPK